MRDRIGWESAFSIRASMTTTSALSHPMRSRILYQLRQQGPATATRLAERLGVNSGATSYHLRQLADAGLVAEDAERGNARDRWWKAQHRGSHFSESELLEQEPELVGAFLHSVAAVQAESLARAIDAMPTLPTAWVDASDMSDISFYLTARQLTAMRDELYDVMDKYRTRKEDPHPRGTRPVTVQLQMFPRSQEPG
jgi:DNA-binding transcriptional ArsR family regulator